MSYGIKQRFKPNPTHNPIHRRKLILQRPSLRKKEGADEVEGGLEDFHVLVINSSQAMAKEITMQLTLAIPGCSIMYAPTLELARLLIRRREIQLVVSSPILPDGSIAKLKDVLEKLRDPPDVVVVGNVTIDSADVLGDSVYDMAALRRLGRQKIKEKMATQKVSSETEKLEDTISTLGADLRNDLNNPLQEIVAMVYVAQKCHGEANPATDQALVAIDKAAKNMAEVVTGLEDKIKNAVRDVP